MNGTSFSCYLIAGEQSGDQLGAGLIDALKQQSPMTFHGIGGTNMQASGLQSLFPMQELSLMGFAEILPHIFRLKRRIRETVADIKAKRPNVVITIDSPGFTFRVVKALREEGYEGSRFVHYVAPTVWAYKPERAAKTAALFDALLTLFKFETPYFTKENLETFWCGHPAAWKPKQAAPIASHRLCVFPGSRKGEAKRLLPLYRHVITRIQISITDLNIVIPAPAHLHDFIRKQTDHWPCPVTIVSSDERADALVGSGAALCKSGTITLECALAGVPGIIAYRAHPISVWIAQRLVKIPYAGLPNILLGREIMPEYIQPDMHTNNMAEPLIALLNNGDEASAQRTAFTELREMLLPEKDRSPSEIAAAHVLDYAARNDAVSSS